MPFKNVMKIVCYIFLDSSFSIVTELWTRRLRDRGSIPGRNKRCFLFQKVHIGSGTRATSYSIDIRSFSPKVRGLGREAGPLSTT
jgi:hypothetical protein